MKKMFAMAVYSLFAATASFSQNTPEDSVKAAISKFFAAMRNNDAIAVRQSFTDSATYENINRDKFGEPVVRATAVMELALLISSVPKGAVDPRINFDMVKVNGNLASAWVPFTFFVNGQISYCAVSSFQLLRINGIWKIQFYIDRKTNCKP